MSKKILIVDDSLFTFEEMKSMLSGTDYEASAHAKNGEEAFKMYAQLMPDIVTMDIILPGLSGLETSKLILGKWKDAKIVIVSSLAYDDTINKAAELGINNFIFKPFEKEELIKALDDVSK
ncbi:response regulator [Anaerotignum faecicola]|nr:response regulator [Anaerotignum faecicola]